MIQLVFRTGTWVHIPFISRNRLFVVDRFVKARHCTLEIFIMHLSNVTRRIFHRKKTFRNICTIAHHKFGN